jgi:hypothetical protein
MVGIGMNEAELKANKHLTKFYVKDLNKGPNFKDISDSSTDVVICNVSVDYVVQPIPIFKEIHRFVSLPLLLPTPNEMLVKKKLTVLSEYSNPMAQRTWHSAIDASPRKSSGNGWE